MASGSSRAICEAKFYGGAHGEPDMGTCGFCGDTHLEVEYTLEAFGYLAVVARSGAVYGDPWLYVKIENIDKWPNFVCPLHSMEFGSPPSLIGVVLGIEFYYPSFR
ncbi:hypothetical protein L6452_18130 [Arctium lappa]|uniref:Uncharacterized protein n=1 Tax=Arctium lappa TaxID=4217 RepID=A0ACB9C5J5_ARCLA|nr:hypothetical protein L6452_18130 [Arctium lappa]